MSSKPVVIKFALFCVGVLLLPAMSQAQTYSINWYKIAGGGGSSAGTNGATVYALNGTIGQQDASLAMTGSNYSLTGGFWSLVALQTPGAPLLTITPSGNSVILSWPSPSTGYFLQSNATSATNTWSVYPGTVVTNGMTNSVTITRGPGNTFFRLGP